MDTAIAIRHTDGRYKKPFFITRPTKGICKLLDKYFKFEHIQFSYIVEDTPEHVKKLQLEIWLSKPPGERLKLAIQSNEELHAFWNAGKKNIESKAQKNK